MGSQRRQHHREQEAMRAANEEANRQKAALEAQQKAFEAQLAAQRESMQKAVESMAAAVAPTPAPVQEQVKSTLGSQGLGIRTAAMRSPEEGGRTKRKRKTKGISSLRIPLAENIESTGTGLNI